MTKNDFYIFFEKKISYYSFYKDFFFLNNIKKYSFIKKWTISRFEMSFFYEIKNYWFFVVVPRYKFFLPSGSSIVKKQTIHILFKFICSSYKGFRHFLCLPVRGNRTWSNHKAIKRAPKLFFELYKKFYFKKYGNYCSEHRKKYILYIEFLNRLWFFHFQQEYEHAEKIRYKYIRTHKYVTWKFDLKNALANKVLTHMPKIEKNNPRKKKKNKKIKYKNNVFNIGFFFFFTRYYQKKIFSAFYVKNVKKKRKPKKKKKK